MNRMDETMLAEAVNAIKPIRGDIPEAEDVQEYAAKQAEGIAKIASGTKADPKLTHDSELRRIISAFDENDCKVAMELIVAKDPFAAFEALRIHMQNLTDDLNDIRKILKDREERIHYICGGE